MGKTDIRGSPGFGSRKQAQAQQGNFGRPLASGVGMGELLDRARVFEDQGAWDRAIDCYLSVNMTNCGLANPRSNKDESTRLEATWENAVRL